MKHRVMFKSRGRALIAVLCLAMFAAMATVAATLSQAPAPTRAADVKLIYVGADDCAPCRAWQNNDGATFRKSAEFSRITYIEVKARHLHDVLKDENWPEQIRDLRNRLKRSDGVPLWLVVSNDEVVAQRFGAAAWHAEILPAIRAKLR